MKYLLDTSIEIDVLRNRNRRRALLAELVKNGHVLATSTMNVAEVYAGMLPAEALETAEFINSLECLPVTTAIASRAGSLKYLWARQGITLSLADMIVAATAIELGLVLITDNRKDFGHVLANLYPLDHSVVTLVQLGPQRKK